MAVIEKFHMIDAHPVVNRTGLSLTSVILNDRRFYFRCRFELGDASDCYYIGSTSVFSRISRRQFGHFAGVSRM